MSGINVLNYVYKELPIKEIEIGDRIRDNYDDITGLAKDIKSNGLINAVCVMHRPGKPYLLLAGGRRMLAIQKLGWVTVPCKIYPELNELQIMVLELSENLNRVDLNPLTVIQQRAKIYELMKQDALDENRKAPTLEVVSKVVGCDKATLSRDLNYYSVIEKFPDVAKDARSRKDLAVNIKKLEEQAIMHAIAKRHEQAQKPTEKITKKISKVDMEDKQVIEDRLKRLLNHFIVGDTFDICERLKKNEAKFNLIEIDPPYGIKYDEIKASESNIETYEEIPEEEYHLFLETTLQNAWDLLAEEGWCILWLAINKYFDMALRLGRAIGFTTTALPAIWTKSNTTGQNNQPNINLSNVYECFLVFRKGKAYLNKPGTPNEFRYPTVKQQTHATEKPVELYKDIFSVFANKGAHVLVMFAGSGSPIIAGLLNGLHILGIDKNQLHKVSYEELLRKYMKG